MRKNAYENLVDKLEEGEKSVIVTILDNECSKSPINKICLTHEDLVNQNNIYNFDEAVYQKVQLALESGNIQFFKDSLNKTYLIEPYFPEPRLVVFGGGHIAKPLVEFGAKLGFKVTVIDDRPSFANTERFPDAGDVICESFEKSFDRIYLIESAFVVIVTRGHRHDMECLRQVLKCKTAYTGMIGSKRRVKSVMEQLLNEGYSKELLDKVNSPIGLEIGAVTPEEIAVSIIAQVVSYRRLAGKISSGNTSLKVNWPELDMDVLSDLSKKKDDPRAIVTIISTKGSVPRKSGAKMIVWPYGKTLGSIGGGCSEGEAIITARDIIRDGGYKVQNIDMTGYIDDEEGMACGGIMEVIIEAYN